jgi:hypothetical protein
MKVTAAHKLRTTYSATGGAVLTWTACIKPWDNQHFMDHIIQGGHPHLRYLAQAGLTSSLSAAFLPGMCSCSLNIVDVKESNIPGVLPSQVPAVHIPKGMCRVIDVGM